MHLPPLPTVPQNYVRWSDPQPSPLQVHNVTRPMAFFHPYVTPEEWIVTTDGTYGGGGSVVHIFAIGPDEPTLIDAVNLPATLKAHADSKFASDPVEFMVKEMGKLETRTLAAEEKLRKITNILNS